MAAAAARLVSPEKIYCDYYDTVTICLKIDCRNTDRNFGLSLINIYTHSILSITFLSHSPSAYRFLGGGE
jgi:hypothetical protein